MPTNELKDRLDGKYPTSPPKSKTSQGRGDTEIAKRHPPSGPANGAASVK
jgi:hypothetical protein